MLSQLSLSYMSMVMNADQWKWHQICISVCHSTDSHYQILVRCPLTQQCWSLGPLLLCLIHGCLLQAFYSLPLTHLILCKGYCGLLRKLELVCHTQARLCEGCHCNVQGLVGCTQGRGVLLCVLYSSHQQIYFENNNCFILEFISRFFTQK